MGDIELKLTVDELVVLDECLTVSCTAYKREREAISTEEIKGYYTKKLEESIALLNKVEKHFGYKGDKNEEDF